MWFKVDDGLTDHRKVRKLGADKLPALGLWTACGAWAGANLSDGFVPTEVVLRFDPELRYAARLVAVGLWVPAFSSDANDDSEPGYWFHEWDEHQPTRADVLSVRASRREAGRAGGIAAAQRRRTATADSKPTAAPVAPAPARGEPGATPPAVASATADAMAAGDGLLPPRPDPTRPDQREGKDTRAARSPSKPDPPGFARFEEFYDAYPRKKSRAEAEKAWRQVVRRGADPDRLISAAHAYAEQCRRRDTDPLYVKHPASWLRAAAYDDEPDPEPRPARPESRVNGWQQLKTPDTESPPPVVDGSLVPLRRSR